MDILSKLDFVVLIMQNSINGSNIMELMNIHPSYDIVKKYLDALQENDLIKYYTEEKIFLTTSKGLVFLYIYNDLVEML
ncbi:MAG: hypothetical protein DA328_03320 [Nitrososphaeraceae archaeon]|nr:hypothetical protein [Nitrososphaeraceae archaeon]